MRLRALIGRKSPSPPEPSVVTRGLIEWFDFMDGKGTETTLKSRVSDNVLTLTNFNFDANSGWTGKGLKFDGVNDYGVWIANFNSYASVEVCFAEEFAPEVSRVLEGLLLYRKNGSENDFMTGQTLMAGASNLSLPPNTRKNIHINVKDKKLYFDSLVVEEYEFGSSLTGKLLGNLENYARFLKGNVYSIKIYNVALTPEEIAQNYEYEQSIDRNVASTYPLLQEQKSYGVGLTNQLSEEQKSIFRLSIDGNKFVAGLRYCEGLEVVQYTYSEIQVEMEKEEWGAREEEEVEYV